MDNGSDTLTRGELAKQCEVNFGTIRYYEQRGLLPRAARSPGNYRLYSSDAVRRLRFIKRAQALGFTLKEVAELLALRTEPGKKCAEVSSRVKSKIRDIDERLRSLQSMRRALSRLVNGCRGAAPISECPILEALDEEDRA